MIRSSCVALALLALLTTPHTGSTQDFEKNSAADIFGENGPKVQVYSPPSDADSKDAPDSALDGGTAAERKAAQVALWEGLCKQVGPKSLACSELAKMKREGAAAPSGKLGFDLGAASDDDESGDGGSLDDNERFNGE